MSVLTLTSQVRWADGYDCDVMRLKGPDARLRSAFEFLQWMFTGPEAGPAGRPFAMRLERRRNGRPIVYRVALSDQAMAAITGLSFEQIQDIASREASFAGLGPRLRFKDLFGPRVVSRSLTTDHLLLPLADPKEAIMSFEI